MVWVGFCSTTKTLLMFISVSAKVDATNYQEQVLKDILKPLGTAYFGEDGFILQDGCAHVNSAKLRRVREELFRGFWGQDLWSSKLPDLNAMENSLCDSAGSILQRKISDRRYDSAASLKTGLTRVLNGICPNLCVRRQVPSPSSKVSKSEGQFWTSVVIVLLTSFALSTALNSLWRSCYNSSCKNL